MISVEMDFIVKGRPLIEAERLRNEYFSRGRPFLLMKNLGLRLGASYKATRIWKTYLKKWNVG
jgi:hypothetical protein